ncbi:Xaa-Pro peptidase family protein [Labrys sp. ZIDIC5]|uniref:M24 family metallopeptidase n=1 Tax=Labrys sedimenti TaxID=3106036 RepID=UPI002ACA1F29|nr:Xaa-Pro peptidase family protein [Labrys sp. ZIDIC5]MDZ5454853.1 Xaa-Pro peptidase family protein [Labrys sp. ZIDIC5]
MDFTGLSSPTELASELRSKLYALVPRDVEVILSSDKLNKAYLSGYASMTHDTAPDYRSAVCATHEKVSLVVSAADAGPAYDMLDSDSALFRYGEFYFETPAGGHPAFDRQPKATFQEACRELLNSLGHPAGLVGVDRSDGDLLWELSRAVLGDACVVDVTRHIKLSRSTKTAAEILRLQKASDITESGYRKLVSDFKIGMTEFDIAALICEQMVIGGGVPRFMSVTSGPRSALADAYPTKRAPSQGELIRIDAGCTYDGYWSDLGRTFIVGEPSNQQIQNYNAIRIGLEEELLAIRPGIKANAVFEIAMKTVRAHGIPSYRRQHCGHGIGLSSYDTPLINSVDDTMLMEGMCLCLETPYYQLDSEGMMVEDTVVVTADGYERITRLPRDLFFLG